MSYKTDRLVDLFPDAYAANERESLLYKLLDAVGAELMAADEAVKQLLKSHWVNYASGGALDGLGSIYGVARRRLPDGTSEPDEAFQLRLKSIVSLFTGGGTRPAVLGAVHSALGFPFDLDQLNLPPAYANLRQDLENLIALVEFSPSQERLVKAVDIAHPGELTLDVPAVSVRTERPRIEWTFTGGAGRRLRLACLDSGEGLLADDAFIVPQGQTLILSAKADGSLVAFLNEIEVSAFFHSLGDGDPILPEVPRAPSRWHFIAEGALFDTSTFDEQDRYDRPLFSIEMAWQRYEPLSFDVYVPYFLQTAVGALKAAHKYPGEIFVYEGWIWRPSSRSSTKRVLPACEDPYTSRSTFATFTIKARALQSRAIIDWSRMRARPS